MRGKVETIAVVNVAFSALNAAYYASEGHAVNLGVAVFCGLIALMLWTER